ncbi:MAG: DMT(drug/metabolite transporter) superfamily permease [Deltaproteobacteria bacterium]|nr:DMT(drug/metabolite transporter) superfamily permease [Deltaproteobacteria bacterium]
MERDRLSDLSLLCVSLIWGVNIVAVKYLLASLSPVNVILVRFITGSVLLFLLLLFFEDVKVPLRDIWRLALLGAIGITVYQFLFTFALKYTSAVNVGILINMSPIYGSFLSSLLGYERFVRKRIIAIIVGFFGVFILMTKGNWSIVLSGDLRGTSLALLASLSWALYTILSKPLLDRHSPLKVTAYSMLAGSALLGTCIPYFFDPVELARLSGTGWMVIIFSIIFSIIIAFFLWYRAVAKIGLSRTMIYQYCVPAAAAAAAYFVSGEKLHIYQLIGGVIIFASVYLARR